MVNWNFIGLASANILSNSCYSMVVPFLPLELHKWGLDISIIGYIFSIYSLAVIFGSPVVGKLLSIVGRKNMLIIGLTSMGCSMIGYGALDMSPNLAVFTFFSFFFRFTQGCSSCSIQTTSYAIVSLCFPDQQEQYIGYLQTSIGVGLLIGPAIGSVLYSLFGFSYTFLIVAAYFLSLVPVMYILIPSSIDGNQNTNENSTATDARVSEYEEITTGAGDTYVGDITFGKLLSIPKFNMAALSGLMGYFVYCYFEPVLSFRVESFGVSPLGIGLFFTIQPAAYILFSVFLPYFTQNIHNRGLIILGALFSGFALFFVGPSYAMPNSLKIMMLGQLLIGAFGLLLLVPPIPEMINCASEKYKNRVVDITDISAGVFNSCLGMGQVFGPIYGSNITKLTDFRICSDTVSLILFVYVILYFVIGDGVGLLRNGCKKHVEKEIDVIATSPVRGINLRGRGYSTHSRGKFYCYNYHYEYR